MQAQESKDVQGTERNGTERFIPAFVALQLDKKRIHEN